jgi:hypothetical protein
MLNKAANVLSSIFLFLGLTPEKIHTSGLQQVMKQALVFLFWLVLVQGVWLGGTADRQAVYFSSCLF